jgi:hypothetical protein
MTRRPGDPEQDPPGGRAAERLRQELESRFPGGKIPDHDELTDDDDEESRSDRPSRHGGQEGGPEGTSHGTHADDTRGAAG